MAKLQPSLLDRLTDLSPEKEKESASQQMVGSRQYKAAVIRDLGWLLNSVSLESVFDLEPYPYVRKSVVNYGLPDISGHTANSIDTFNLEHELQKAICESPYSAEYPESERARGCRGNEPQFSGIHY
jgi:type VI secretion system protein ImpF